MMLRQLPPSRRCSQGWGATATFPDFLRSSIHFPNTSHGGCMADEILTIREVAELLKINEKTAYKLALAGEIPGFKVGGSWRFQRQEIANWIKRKVEEQQGGSGGA